MKNSFWNKEKFRFDLTNCVKRFHFADFNNKTMTKTFSSSSPYILAKNLPVRRLHKVNPTFIIFEQPKMSINQAILVRENSHHEIY